eukprot:scaffold15022_cov117-Isochrysis_galbana.AAC.14
MGLATTASAGLCWLNEGQAQTRHADTPPLAQGQRRRAPHSIRSSDPPSSFPIGGHVLVLRPQAICT